MTAREKDWRTARETSGQHREEKGSLYNEKTSALGPQ